MYDIYIGSKTLSYFAVSHEYISKVIFTSPYKKPCQCKSCCWMYLLHIVLDLSVAFKSLPPQTYTHTCNIGFENARDHLVEEM